MAQCLIGLGSNLGDRAAALDRAVRRLEEHPQIQVVGKSRWRETAPIGGPAGQDDFLNGAVRLETDLTPHALWAWMRQIETEAGRRRGARWGPRIVDLDLLLFGRLMLDTPSLRIPHPRMAFRRFVLAPATEVAADMVHPEIGWTVARLWRHSTEATPYFAFAGPIGVGKTTLVQRVLARIPGKLIAEPVDEGLLSGYYVNPGGHAVEVEIELLRRRAEVLTSARRQDRTDLSISDFWFDQSLAYAAVWLSGDRLDAIREAYSAASRHVVRPKLLVLLDMPSRELLARIARRGRPYEKALTAAWLDKLRAALADRAAEPDQGPVLRVEMSDVQSAITEVTAAVQAIHEE